MEKTQEQPQTTTPAVVVPTLTPPVDSKKPRQTLTFVLGIDISPARVSKQLRLTLQRNKYGSLFNFPGKPPVSVSPDATTTVNVVKKSTTKQTLRVSSEAHIALSAILDKALKEVVRDTIKYAIENKKNKSNQHICMKQK